MIIQIPPDEIDDGPDGPEPLVWRHVTIVEGIDPDGTSWVTLLGDASDEALRSMVAAAGARFPVQRNAEPW